MTVLMHSSDAVQVVGDRSFCVQNNLDAHRNAEACRSCRLSQEVSTSYAAVHSARITHLLYTSKLVILYFRGIILHLSCASTNKKKSGVIASSMMGQLDRV